MKVKEPSASSLTRKKVYTYQDYLSLPDDGLHYQVINGELVVTPAPGTIHQEGTREHSGPSQAIRKKASKRRSSLCPN